MSHPDEVADHLKNPEHVIPVDVWEQIRADAAKEAEEAAKDGR